MSLVTIEKCECGEVVVKVAIVGPNSDRCPKCNGILFSNLVTYEIVTQQKTPTEAK